MADTINRPKHSRKPQWRRLYARHFPMDTDGSSRWVKMVSEDLRDKKHPLHVFVEEFNGRGEAIRMAEAFERTVIALWKAREYIRKLKVAHD